MNRLLQDVVFRCYRMVLATGFFSTSLGQAFFDVAYRAYKRYYEAGPIDSLARLVTPGSTIVDVGANVGFFTERFASWVSDGGRVIAIEPESWNFERLERAIARHGHADKVWPVRAAAAEAPGEARLEINPLHPGDHKLGDAGIPVRLVTVDGLLAERNWPEVSLVKIDVQGAELRVIEGAAETIRRFRPALFVEIEDRGLARMGTSAEALVRRLVEHGYRPHRLRRARPPEPVDAAAAVALAARRGYADIVFLAADADRDTGG